MTSNVHDLVQIQVEGSQEKIDRLARYENFTVNIMVSPDVLESLTEEQIDRLEAKLKMVEYSCQLQAAGMLKGVIKYSEDKHTLHEWFAHIVTEGADQQNYNVLGYYEFLEYLKKAELE